MIQCPWLPASLARPTGLVCCASPTGWDASSLCFSRLRVGKTSPQVCRALCQLCWALFLKYSSRFKDHQLETRLRLLLRLIEIRWRKQRALPASATTTDSAILNSYEAGSCDVHRLHCDALATLMLAGHRHMPMGKRLSMVVSKLWFEVCPDSRLPESRDHCLPIAYLDLTSCAPPIYLAYVQDTDCSMEIGCLASAHRNCLCEWGGERT